ncbi:MAG: flagellar biosynthetic protein FliO [Candidatus Goldbacteria bacterium]|nr:flagellar biosynthetic protein FliO [Candidatus Goldiibacteriota bacterium]
MKIKLFIITLVFFFSTFDTVIAGKQELNTNAISNTINVEYLSNEIKNVENPELPHGPNIVSTTINILLSLLLIIGLIYLTIIILKYFYSKSKFVFKNNGIIKIITKEHIDSKKIIYLVDVVNKILIVGAGNNELVLLSEIADKETIENIRQQANEYVSKQHLKNEIKFSDNLKSTYIKQGKKLVNNGNETVKNIINKLRKKQ